MSNEKSNSPKGKEPARTPGKPPGTGEPIVVSSKRPPLFRRLDWIVAAVTTLCVFIGYYYTLAPDLTLEDSGELAVASYYAGVPHPPGYPVWTIYTWLFTLIPISNIAWRVALSSAVAGAFACGLVALAVSRGSSMLLEGIADFKNLERRVEGWICVVAGFLAGMLMGFNGFMWSQAVIVEVYTLSVLSFMAVLVCLLRWIYAPDQKRYLYWAWFLFGICFTNHQTLIVATMGIQILMLAARPKLGRDWFLLNSIVYIIGLLMKSKGSLTAFNDNLPLFMVYNFVGLGSLIVCGWVTMKTQELATEWKDVLATGSLWVAGAAFYFYMPIASMTNPPLNWGYPRTVEGFFHALTRGQYDKTSPTSDLWRFVDQIRMYFEGAADEFSFVFLLIGLIPFLFFPRMQKRERAWLTGLTAIYLFLAVLLLILLNPSTDKQSREQARVFFAASHIVVAMAIGYGVTLIGGVAATQYHVYRRLFLWAGAAACGIELYYLFKTLDETQFKILRFAAWFSFCLALAFTGSILAFRNRSPSYFLLVLFAIAPIRSITSNWSDNEQRGHLFGYWFGHDMFTPPFGIYPEMARNAILFGGTDPGRFNPTYMIFCESFIPPECKPLDPKFDRRDVYIITQNALADGTYLSYIRAHYNRSAQKDPYFFSELVRSQKARELNRTNLLAKMLLPLDRFFTRLGEKIEKDRREDGVYPPKEIITPTVEDSQQAFQDYITDASRRAAHDDQFPNEPRQLKPGEDVRIDRASGRVSVSGQVAVMAINGLLTKVIFDKNPGHEFYVEESFPLDWMYPHLTPFGIIMKINREPVPEITDEMVKQDHDFWSKYSERLIGNWITYETSIKEICDFAEKTYLQRDFSGFTGDRKFVRDQFSQKAFSKLRSAIGGLYSWRLTYAVRNPEDQQRMLKEADFSLRQAFAYCPYSPEACYKLAMLLASVNRLDDALLVVETSLKFDPQNGVFRSMADQIRSMRDMQLQSSQLERQVQQAQAPGQPQLTLSNLQQLLQAASAYLQLNQTSAALQTIDRILASPAADVSVLLSSAQLLAQARDTARLTLAVQRMKTMAPALEQQFQAQPENVPLGFQIVSIYLITQQTNEAMALLDKLLANPKADASTLFSAAQAYAQMVNTEKLETTMRRLIDLMPTNPEAWYDLGTVQASLGKSNEAVQSISKAIQLSDDRLKAQPGSKDLRTTVAADGRLAPLQAMPEFKQLLAPQTPP